MSRALRNARTTRGVIVASVLCGVAFLASCSGQDIRGGGDQEVDSEVGAALQEEGKVQFADNLWLESAVQAELMTAIVNELGGDAEVLQGDTASTLAAASKGQPIVGMSFWAWQYPDLEQQYFEDEKSVVSPGVNVYTAEEGWYVPTYVIKGDKERGIEATCPGLPNWEALNDCVDVFATSKSGDKGSYISGEQAFKDVYGDPLKIENLGLNYEMTFAGSEAALNADLTRAYEQGTPWLGLMYRPNYMTLKYDLTRVEFPEYTDECWGDTFACQFPDTISTRYASSEIESEHPALYSILEKYDLNDDQLKALQALVVDDGMSPAEAAKSWMQDNPDTWAAWIK